MWTGDWTGYPVPTLLLQLRRYFCRSLWSGQALDHRPGINISKRINTVTSISSSTISRKKKQPSPASTSTPLVWSWLFLGATTQYQHHHHHDHLFHLYEIAVLPKQALDHLLRHEHVGLAHLAPLPPTSTPASPYLGNRFPALPKVTDFGDGFSVNVTNWDSYFSCSNLGPLSHFPPKFPSLVLTPTH